MAKLSHEWPGSGQLADSADEVVILRSRSAGRGDSEGQLDQLQSDLAEGGYQSTLYVDVDAFRDRVQRSVQRQRLRTAVAAGGDGTAALVANLTPPDTALSVFPLGTENLLAKYLGFGGHSKSLSAAIAAGKTARLDAGQVTDSRQPARLFLLMAGMGFDAEVVHRLHRQRRGHIRHLSYAAPLCSTIRDYGYPLLRIRLIDDAQRVQRELTARWAFVFNLPMYASRLAICPQATPADGQLDLVTYQAGSLGQGLRVLAYVLLGQSQRLAGVQFARGVFFRIEAADPAAEVPYQVDGDPGGTLPVEIRVLPQRLRVLVPPDWEPRWARGAACTSR